jgi:parvulin-like peptidyl-prolyl isomerase
MRKQLLPAIAEAVFAAKQGAILGPLTTHEGFHLLLVEELAPAQLDGSTAALVRDELFDAWLRDALKDAELAIPLFDIL